MPVMLKILTNKNIILCYLTLMLVQFSSLTILGGTTFLKLLILGIAPLFIIFRVPYVNRALIFGIIYLLLCYFVSLFHGDLRISTIAFSAMYVFSYICVYNLIQLKSISIQDFIIFLRYMILAYGLVLILQQVCMIIGLRNMPVINLSNQFFISLTKLPSLSLEPSHSARILTALFLAWMRCLEIREYQDRLTIRNLFERENRYITLLFLWSMLTMGSGTAFIGLGILALYFVRLKNLFLAIPILGILFYVGQSMEIKQFDRAVRVAKVVTTGDVQAIQSEDGSASSRIIPVINTLTIDVGKIESWVGYGTVTKEYAASGWKRTTDTIPIVHQYGLVAFIVSLLLVYTCMIYRIFSLETLLFLGLMGLSLHNVAYVWGIMMLFTAVRFFQEEYMKSEI